MRLSGLLLGFTKLSFVALNVRSRNYQTEVVNSMANETEDKKFALEIIQSTLREFDKRIVVQAREYKYAAVQRLKAVRNDFHEEAMAGERSIAFLDKLFVEMGNTYENDHDVCEVVAAMDLKISLVDGHDQSAAQDMFMPDETEAEQAGSQVANPIARMVLVQGIEALHDLTLDVAGLILDERAFAESIRWINERRHQVITLAAEFDLDPSQQNNLRKQLGDLFDPKGAPEHIQTLVSSSGMYYRDLKNDQTRGPDHSE